MTTNSSPASSFPKDFVFGVATAAYQIEGAHDEDGRKPSIWDAFSKMPGRVHNGDTGDVACDHYHRWETDLDLIKSLHMDAYRFSIAWPRIIPEGTGPVNSAGIGFYDKLIDGCLERGLQPFATLYHWDLPIQLHGHGGWTVRTTAQAFADYAEVIARHFGDRLQSLMTLNEPWCSSVLSHLLGIHAPGEKSMPATVAAIHTLNLAHGLATQAIRSHADVPVGIALNLHSSYPGSDEPQHIAAESRAFDFHNRAFLDPLFRGQYPQSFVEALSQWMPDGWQQDLPDIHQPLDYWGLNYYTPARVLDNPNAAYPATKQAPCPIGAEKTDIGWEIQATAFSDLIRRVYSEYTLPPCYITENGACFNDEPINGKVDDLQRIRYLDSHLTEIATVVTEGQPVKGYFAWSLMDNFEWAEGYKMRFGLVHVDYDTQVRTIKESGHWYSRLASGVRTTNQVPVRE